MSLSPMFKIISSPARIWLSNSSSKGSPQHCAVRSMYIRLGAQKHERSSISAACDWRHAKSSTADFNFVQCIALEQRGSEKKQRVAINPLEVVKFLMK